MPSQIEIANSLRRTDIFQLDARKGHAPPPEDEGRRETVSVAVVAVEVRRALTVNTCTLLTLRAGSAIGGMVGSKRGH